MTKVFLIAGEASGDLLGGRLMKALRDKQDTIQFMGVGGAKMTQNGLTSLFPMEELSVMGVAEVLPKLSALIKRINQTVDTIIQLKPDVVVTIDSPDFCFRVVKKLKAMGFDKPCVHYVTPSVWAWRPGRAKKIAGFLDHAIALLPFEPPYFEKEGLPCTFVGHSVIESNAARGNAYEFREKHGIDLNAPLLCMLPGSRNSELNKLLPVFLDTCRLLIEKEPGLRVAIPTLPHLTDKIRTACDQSGIEAVILDNNHDKYDCFAAADIALAASGTVSLELAMAQVPSVIGYRFNLLTTLLVKLLVKGDYASLVNITMGKEIVPEFLLGQCKSDLLADKLHELLTNVETRTQQIAGYRDALNRLGLGLDQTPSERAADVVLEIISSLSDFITKTRKALERLPSD